MGGYMKHLSTIIIVAILTIICVFAVISYVKKIKHGCCGSDGYGSTGTAEKRIKIIDKKPEHYKSCVQLTISGMTCSRCKLRVENALNAKKNVWAEVNLKEGTALVRMKEELPDDTLRRIVSRAGYTVIGVEKIS